MSESKSLIPKNTQVQPEQHRRRFIGLLLFLVAFLILLPEWHLSQKHENQRQAQQGLFTDENMAGFEPLPEMAIENDAQSPYTNLNDIEAGEYDKSVNTKHQVEKKTLEDAHASPWQSNYNEMEMRQKFVKPAWFVQVASLSTEASAKTLMKKLQASGFRTELRPSLVDDQYIYRVMVGPQLRRAEAESVSKQLQTQFNLRPILKTFYPAS